MATKLFYENDTTNESVDITGMWDEGHEFQRDLQDALVSIGSAHSNIKPELDQNSVTIGLNKLSDAEKSLDSALRELIGIAEEEGYSQQIIADMIGISTARLKNITKD